MAARKLRRSRTDRIIAGVCGGLGEYFQIDPVIMRIAFVALVFIGGSGIIAYALLALLIPLEEGSEHTTSWSVADVFKNGRGRDIVGAALVIIGLLALLNIFFPLAVFMRGFIVPLVLIVVGILLLVQRNA